MSIGWDTGGASSPPSGPAGGDLGGAYPDLIVVEGLQGVPVSATAPTIVGQSLKWSGSAWAPDLTVFGTEFSFAERFTPLGTTLPPPGILYLRHTTPALVGGQYVISVTIFLTGSQTNTQLSADLLIDAFSLNSTLEESGVAGGRFTNSAVLVWTFAPGVHTVDLTIALGGGAGTVTALDATIAVWRVA